MSARSLLFASWHAYIDQSNGASISTRTLLSELARRGWKVRTLCAFAQDFQTPHSLNAMIEEHGASVMKTVAHKDYVTTSFLDGRIESLALVPRASGRIPSSEDSKAFLQLLKETLARTKPAVLLTYGGYNLGSQILGAARLAGVKNAVSLHNLAYRDKRYFRNADAVIVPSQFAADYYRREIGLETTVVPPLIQAPGNDALRQQKKGKYVLFVNPEIGKGILFLIAVAKEIWSKRRDIRFLVVEGRSGIKTLLKLGKDRLKGVENIDFARNTTNFSALYRSARITVFPSLYRETFGRVPVESMNAGVPVVVSDRGALPETVGDGGLILTIPDKFQPDRLAFPNGEEAAPWVNAIIRLWDDGEYYIEMQKKGWEQAKKWNCDKVANMYETFLTNLCEGVPQKGA